MENNAATREEMIKVCRRINASDLNLGTAGNLSVRIPGGLLITPSGVPYDTMTTDQIVEMDEDGRYYGDYIPSSEWRFHYDILMTRGDVNAVLHTHAPYCSILACCRLDIEPIHYMVGVGGGSVIKCSDYAPFGTPELSHHALEALGPRNACLLGNHGVIAVGPSMGKALDTLQVVEYLARVSIGVRTLGAGVVLPEHEIAVVLQRFKTYGKQATDLTPADLADPNRVVPPERAGDRLAR